MCRKLPLFLALTILYGVAYAENYRCLGADGYYAYSDKPCETDGAGDAESSPEKSERNLQSGNNEPAGTKIYTKDMASMPSPDAATQACLNYVNTTARFPDPATTRLLGSEKKWVTVKDVGGRQMVTINITSKNEAGMYVEMQSFNCLLMGDNVTINTGTYELL